MNSLRHALRRDSSKLISSSVSRYQYYLSKVSSYHSSQVQSQNAEPSSSNEGSEERSPPSEKIVKLVDEITSLTLLEVSDLTALIRKRLGLSDIPMMPMGMMPMPGAGAPGAAAAAPEEKKEEKTEFDVKLEKFDATAKLKVIKEIRGITGLGLKESKDLVEKAPIVFKKSVSKDEANVIIEKLKAVGASCVLE